MKEVKGPGTDAAQLHHRAGLKRPRRWPYAVAAVLLAAGLLGLNGWLASQETTWNMFRIWGLAKLGLYGGPEMIEIRPGDPEKKFPADFEMGSTEGPSYARPVHSVHFDKPFAIGVHEITFDEYGAYTLDEGLERPDDLGWGRGNRPVINVSWDEVQEYTKWLTAVTGKRYRLPTEAEWEYVARAGTTTNYWWGNDVDQDGKAWANCRGCGSEWDGKKTAPVRQFPANPFGLYDTAGNVREWVEDCWHNSYDNAPDDGSAWLDRDDGYCGRRMMRGGSWSGRPGTFRSATRRSGPASGVGLRVAQDPD